MVVGRGGEVELGEDGPHVRLDGLVRDEEGVCDGQVGASLGHQGQDVHFSLAEGVERVAPAGAANEHGDDCGVHDEPTRVDLADCVAEFIIDVARRILRLYVLG